MATVHIITAFPARDTV